MLELAECWGQSSWEEQAAVLAVFVANAQTSDSLLLRLCDWHVCIGTNCYWSLPCMLLIVSNWVNLVKSLGDLLSWLWQRSLKLCWWVVLYLNRIRLPLPRIRYVKKSVRNMLSMPRCGVCYLKSDSLQRVIWKFGWDEDLFIRLIALRGREECIAE